LANALGAHVWPNVYATGVAGTPFDMHFDAHEVIAIHCAGEKTWDISRVRVDRPLEAPEMQPAIRSALRARSDEAARNIDLSCTVSPGDLVYIPRGQFHNARTLEGRSLHVTFGIEIPSGFDLAKRIMLDLLADPRMRDYLPPRVADTEGQGARAWYEVIASRIAQAASPEALATAREELQQVWVKKSGGDVQD
jgi:ribosomal protein L16 Arg81 hydroxylase